jgi:hypothetical protein
MKSVYLFFATIVVLCNLALAQTTGDDKTAPKSDEGVINIHENKGEEQPVTPQPVQPLQPQPDPVQPVNPAEVPTGDNMPAPLDEEKSRQISRYFEEALQNYRDILGQQETAEIETTEKRIGSNQKLLDDQKQKLDTSKTALRKVQLEYIRRYLALKNSHQQGAIDKKTYEAELDKLGREYKFQVSSLTGDVGFWKGQQGKTSQRLKTLQDVNRINRIMLDKKGVKSPQNQQRQPTELDNLVQRIQTIGCFQEKNMWTATEIK